ncbi:MAG: CPBP family intramembrane glutamic endopeptidase [Alkalispirochaeta sp.]
MLARTPEQALQFRRLRETAILFTLFVVPGLTSSAPITQVVGALGPLVALTIRNTAFALLVLYLLDIQGEQRLVHRHGGEGEAFPPAVMIRVWAILLGVSLLVSAIAGAVGEGEVPVGTGSVVTTLRERYHVVIWLPAIVVAMVSVGFAEELLFRGYFIARIQQMGGGAPSAVLTSALLFSIGHGYQGVPALVFSFLAGMSLGWLWVRRPHLGAFAIGHAAYNISALALAVWYS